MLEAADSPYGAGRYTHAGRALQKHAEIDGRPNNRPGAGAFRASSQRPGTLNAEARRIVEDILSAPGTRYVRRTARMNGRAASVIDVVAPDGRTLRFDSTGTRFIGFREP